MRMLPGTVHLPLPEFLGEPVRRPVQDLFLVLMSYPMLLDGAYRNERYRRSMDPRLNILEARFQERIRSLQGTLTPALAKVLEVTLSFSTFLDFLASGAKTSTTRSQKLADELVKFCPEWMRESWDSAMIADLESLHPLDREGPDDLKEFLMRPLWTSMPPAVAASEMGRSGSSVWNVTLGGGKKDQPVPLPFSQESRRRYVEYLGGENQRFSPLVELLWNFLKAPMDWNRVIDCLLATPDEVLSDEQAREIERLSTDRQRLASLLARMALNERTRLNLAEDPSLADFREAFQSRGFGAATVLKLEQELQTQQKDFAPNALWLAWVQTVHRPALESIQNEMRSWLSQGKTSSVPATPSEKIPEASKRSNAQNSKESTTRKTRK